MKLICFFILYFFPSILFCQSSNDSIEKLLIEDFNYNRASGSILHMHNYHFDSSNARHFLDFFNKYDSDASINTKYEIELLRTQITLKSSDIKLRRSIVEVLIKNLESSDPFVLQECIFNLSRFSENDFTENVKYSLAEKFDRLKNNHQYILLCGLAQVKVLKSKLKAISYTFNNTVEGWWRTTAWYACLALARMGDQEKIDEMIEGVEKINDETEKVIFLLKNLAYTKNTKCFKLLKKYLEREDNLPSGGRDVAHSDYKTFALHYLAEYFDGFPVKKSEFYGYTKDDINTSRTFMKQKFGDK